MKMEDSEPENTDASSILVSQKKYTEMGVTSFYQKWLQFNRIEGRHKFDWQCWIPNCSPTNKSRVNTSEFKWFTNNWIATGGKTGMFVEIISKSNYSDPFVIVIVVNNHKRKHKKCIKFYKIRFKYHFFKHTRSLGDKKKVFI